jgi:hypothetical protein
MGAPAVETTAAPVLDSLPAVNAAMYRLLLATVRREKLVAERDEKIAAIQKERGPWIDKAAAEILSYETQIQAYYVANRELLEQGKKSVQLSNGLMGMSTPSNPALVPLNEKWTWEAIAAKVKELWKKKYFHAPKPPGLDKVKLKKSLDEKQLAKCGLKLDTSETFYYELNRLANPDLLESAEANERAVA